MVVVTSAAYDFAAATLLGGKWAWTTTVKVMLTTSGYTPTKATDDYKNDVTNEVSGTGYSAGGQAIVSPTISDPATKVVTCDSADPAWTTATITARVAVWYYNTGVDGTSPLIVYCNFGADVSSTGGTFTITLAAGGLFTFTNGDAV